MTFISARPSSKVGKLAVVRPLASNALEARLPLCKRSVTSPRYNYITHTDTQLCHLDPEELLLHNEGTIDSPIQHKSIHTKLQQGKNHSLCSWWLQPPGLAAPGLGDHKTPS
eukprot:7217955-Prymnesium_polylepis.1